VDIFHVKIRNAGTVAVEARQLADFRQFNQACIAQLWCAFDQPPSPTVWNRHINAALRNAVRLERAEETRHRHGTSNWGDEEVEWTVHERIPRNGVGLLSGPFGSFKTFILLEIAGRLMAGISFLGKKVRRQCGTLIFAAEGANTIRPRIRAMIEHRLAKVGLLDQHDLNLNALPFTLVGNCRPLRDPRTVDWMVAQARIEQEHFRSQHGVDLGFIGIDTLAAAAGWDSENDAVPVQIVMNHMARVSRATDTFVLAVDHFGRDTTKGSRGSTAKGGAPDTIFYIQGTDDNLGGFTNTKLVLRKNKGGFQGLVFPFTAREVEIGTDRYGEPQTSRIIDWNVERDKQEPQSKDKPEPKKKPSVRAMLEDVLAKALDQHGTEIKANGKELA
jgi:RecA-family ATPase